MKRPSPFFFLILALGIPAGSPAEVIHVPADQPTIQAGIDSSSDGDTVLIAPGTYYENINLHGRKIVLAGHYLLTRAYEDILNTVIDGSQPADPDTGSCVLFIGGEDSTTVLEGFTLTGGTGTVWRDIHNGNFYREGGGILCEFSAPVIRYNIITGNDASGPGGTSAGGGGVRIGDANPTLIGNVIAYNSGKYGGGIVLNYTAARLFNNIVYRNSGGADFGGSGIWLNGNGSGPKIIENNTVMENVSSTYGGGIYVSNTTATVRNNIIWANTAPEDPQIALDGGTLTVTYSDVQGGWAGAGNINADPGIGDTTHRLEPASPCIDAGNPGAVYDDPEDTLNPGAALEPSRGALRNDMGAFGGPRRVLVYLRIHRNAPVEPSNVTAYSDYATPGSMALAWNDPTELFNGNPVPSFVIRLYRDSSQIATIDSGVQAYTDTGLVLHQFYRYMVRSVTAVDSSPLVEVSAYAGGSAFPAPPTGLTPSDGPAGCLLGWLNPSRQTDGTPLNDLATAYIHRDGQLSDSIPMSAADTGLWKTYQDTAAGYHSYRVVVRDDETPRHQSAMTDSVLGYGGLNDTYSEDFEGGKGFIYATGAWDTTSAVGYRSGHSLTDSPAGNSTISTTYVFLPPVRLDGRYVLGYRNIGIIRGGQFASVEISTNGRKTFTAVRMYNSFFSPMWQDGSADSSDWISFSFDLSPYAGDTATVRLKLQTGPLAPWDGWYIDDVSIERADPDTLTTLQVSRGWNMVSLPVDTAGAVDVIFPSIHAPAWSYDGAYARADSLVPGPGYWVKFDSGASPELSGTLIPADTLTVKAKWNMIGAVGYAVDSSAVRTQPAGIIQSSFYTYDPDSGYVRSGVLGPGRAYWVRVSTPGKIIRSLFYPSVAVKGAADEGGVALLSEIEITDADGRRGTLGYGPADSAAAPAELPPAPPAGAFDVRFASGLSVERPENDGLKEAAILLSGFRFPVTLRWRPAAGSPVEASIVVNGAAIPIDGEGGTTVDELSRPLLLRISGQAAIGVPAGFSLAGNYPNPFNPSTKISFALPVERFVSLAVYDLLGREVAELAGRVMEAGRHDLVWDAAGFSAGVYLYRLSAGEFSARGKMVLLN